MDLLRYGITARTVEMVCFDAALERLSSLCPDLDINAYKKRVKKEYRAMLARTPDIGGSSLEKNLYVAAFVFSFYKAEPSCITPAIVDEMVTAVFDSPFMVKAHKNKKCTLFTESTQNKKRRESKASQHSKYPLDWKFEYREGKDEFYNTYTECGICKMGKKEGCFEFVPCLCNMDERSYFYEGGELHRTKTLAQGDDCCDFHVTKRKK
jgi:hypothetical protein